MKFIRKFVAFPFVFIGAILLFLGCVIAGGLDQTAKAFEAMREGLFNAKKNS